jgi:hypothetical protein
MSVKSATAIDKCNKTDREINPWVVLRVVIAMQHPPIEIAEIAIVEEEIKDPAEIAPHNLPKTTDLLLVRETTTGRDRRKLTVFH